MKKILIVDDSVNFQDTIKSILKRNNYEAEIIILNGEDVAIKAISSEQKDFDVLLLDGDLGFGGHGRNVLKVLTPEQIKRTIICSENDEFITQVQIKGVTKTISFRGVRPSQLDSYVLEKIEEVES